MTLYLLTYVHTICTVLYIVIQSYPTLCDPMDCSPPGLCPWGFSRQEYWNGWPCPSPGNLPNPGIKPMSLALQVDSLPSGPPGKPVHPIKEHLKQRYYFADKGPDSQNCGFSSSHVQMWELDLKKSEHWRTDAFELWCCRRLPRVPWTARSNELILKEINCEYSLEGLMLKLQYFGHLMQRANSLEKTLMLGKIEGKLKMPVKPRVKTQDIVISEPTDKIILGMC